MSISRPSRHPVTRLIRLRWLAIACYWSLQSVAAYFVGIPLSWLLFEDAGELFSSLGGLLFVGLFLVLQLMFIAPVRRPVNGVSGTSVYLSLAIGGLLVAALVVAGAYAVANFADLYTGLPQDIWPESALPILFAAWLVSTPLLIAFCRQGPRARVLERLSCRLFLGSMVEAAAIIPLDVMVRRRSDCVCATGTYTGLAICFAVGLFVCGPAILLPLMSHRRRRWHRGHCEVCGYDMRGSRKHDRCPECGAGWRAARNGDACGGHRRNQVDSRSA